MLRETPLRLAKQFFVITITFGFFEISIFAPATVGADIIRPFTWQCNFYGMEVEPWKLEINFFCTIVHTKHIMKIGENYEKNHTQCRFGIH